MQTDEEFIAATARELINQMHTAALDAAESHCYGRAMELQLKVVRRVLLEMQIKDKKIKKARKFLDSFAIKQGWVQP